MQRPGTSIVCGALFAVAFGCNSLLENEPGRLDRGASAGQVGDTSSEDGNGAAPISGNEPDGGGASASTDETSSGSSGGGSSSSGDVGVGPDAGAACAVGLKACADLCVSAEDPFFGCAGPGCARCEVANATAACVLGACGVGACVAGFGDCNAAPGDGCETNVQTSLEHCGGCGLVCPQVKNAVMACVGGVCTGTCTAGFGDCNGDPEDGCEKNLMKDRNNCGACGTRCLFARCVQGVCVL